MRDLQSGFWLDARVVDREDMMPSIAGQNQTTGNQVSYRGSMHTNHVTPEGTTLRGSTVLGKWVPSSHCSTTPPKEDVEVIN